MGRDRRVGGGLDGVVVVELVVVLVVRMDVGMALGGAVGGKFAHRVVMSALDNCWTVEQSYKFSGIKLDYEVARK